MECMNKCGKETNGRSKYCGSACKVAYNRNKQSVTFVTEKTVTSKSVTSAPATLTDACGNVHNIDVEGRKADAKLLKSWAKGRGYRRLLGHLALGYSIINGYVPKEG